MKRFKTIVDLKKFLQLQKIKNKSIGLVPTMGSLHEGHESLVNRSKKENNITVVSIYVNPTQFEDNNDFKNYPRNIKSDFERLQKLNCDIVFYPTTQEMYGEKEQNLNKIRLGNLNKLLEAKKRPGHFEGVIRIVAKLLEIVTPDNAYFGEKDFQQLLVVKKMAKERFNQINIVSCDTIRNKNGIAKSSRNKKLNTDELTAARLIYRLLCEIKINISKWGIEKSKKYAQKYFDKDSKINLDYFEIIEQESFSFTKQFSNKNNYRAMIAVKIGEVRLIDNLKL